MEAIERHLYWAGSVGRGELIDQFGISPQQASADFKLYLESAKEVVFNSSIKRYQPEPEYLPQYISTDIQDYIQWKQDQSQLLETVPRPDRVLSPTIVSQITRSIHQGYRLHIRYRSLENPRGTLRDMSPHSLVFNGFRYHVRAYCHTRSAFRDFVLSRIVSTGEQGLSGPTKSDDDEWNKWVIVRIGPHPKLDDDQKKIITIDYGMKRGETVMRIRQALLFYFLRSLNLDGKEHQRNPIKQQVVLLNQEIYRLVNLNRN